MKETWKKSKKCLKKYKERRVRVKKQTTFLRLISPLIIEWTITYVVQIGMFLFMPELLDDAVVYTMLVSLAIIPVMIWMYKRDSVRYLVEDGQRITGITILAIIMLGIVSCTSMNVLIGLSGLAKYSEKYQEVSSVIYEASKTMQILAVVVIAPIVEELVYRGLIYRRMREIGPVLPASLISAFVFGINHGNLVQFVFAAGIGILLAMAYEKYRKISIPIIMHMSVNLTSLIWTWLGQIN